jgi:hypothetical protein
MNGFLLRCGSDYPIRRRDAAALCMVVQSFIAGITSLVKDSKGGVVD